MAERRVERTIGTPNTEGASDSPSRPEPSDASPGTEPTTEETPSKAVRRETAIAGTPEEDLAPPGEVPPDVPRTEEVPRSPRTAGIEEGALPGTEQAPPPRPEPSGDFPGTEPIRGDVSTARTGAALPLPEEVPPERAGEIPTAEEIPPPRAEEVPSAGEAPSVTSPRAPSVDAEPTVPGEIPHEDMVPPTPPPPRDVHSGTSPESQTGEAPRPKEERVGQEEREEDKGLVNRARDYLLGEGRER
jgi:hypothetical protein